MAPTTTRAVAAATLLIVAAVLFAGATAKMVWDPIDAAASNKEKHKVLFATSVTIDGKEFMTGYTTLLRSGAKDPAGSGAVFGQLFDKDGNKINKINNVTFGEKNEPDISNDEDFSSILQVGDKLFMIVHFEFPNPAATYLVELDQDKDNGVLSVTSFERIDWSKFSGIWTPCAGSVTPWQTHFGSEEFGPNARNLDVESQDEWDALKSTNRVFDVNTTEAYMRYYGFFPNELKFEDIKSNFNPYLYGYPWEGKVSEDKSVVVVKRFALGRSSVELPFVMPDNKTVYIMDDGTNRVLTLFKADKAGDMSKGTLYAAKVNQINDFDGGIFEVEWINMGDASDDDISPLTHTTRFSDIFEAADPNITTYPDNKGCPEGFTSINVDVGHECLKLKKGMELPASRLETRRYAAILGATTEWSKMEGFTYSPLRRKSYMAMSEIREGMEDNTRKGVEGDDRHDIGGNNDIRLPYNPCGCVYEVELDDDYFATKLVPLICGKPDFTPGIPSSQICDIDSIANPDNLAVIIEHDGIIIGEDTSNHQNDVIWYMDLKIRDLQRILSTPYGSETTSPYYYPDINGWSYIVAVVQHPYRESDQSRLLEEISTGDEGYVGYIGPFPSNGRESA